MLVTEKLRRRVVTIGAVWAVLEDAVGGEQPQHAVDGVGG
jgi:hypothetical protein